MDVTQIASRAAPAAGDRQVLVPSADRGSTTIADSIVAKVAALAAREVEGVAGLGRSISSAIGDVVGRIRGHETAGVDVEVGSTQAAVDLSVTIYYPAPLHQVIDRIRRNVVDHVESLVGLQVVEVNITVVDLVFPDDAESAPRVR